MAIRSKRNARKKAVVIVAHPDDETIWMGGFILEHSEFDWTILSLCRASDADRAPKFKKVCERYGAKGLIEDGDDEDRLDFDGKIREIKHIISKHLAGEDIHILFTHGRNGEYGHEGHVATHEAVISLLKNEIIATENAFCFSYVKADRKQFGKLRAAKNSDMEIGLSKKTFAAKLAIMTDIYGFAAGGIDASYCTNPEAFRKLAY
ncbi:hypothetical protein HGA64_00285 [Candidatus Falkowbacteria bacterium]|nr:hypothetical protein [Candidatus Falkowbacteria bacterium]